MTYRVLITDEYGYTDVLADGFETREQAQRFVDEVRKYIWHPENVKLDIEEVPYDITSLIAVGIPVMVAVVLFALYRFGVLRF